MPLDVNSLLQKASLPEQVSVRFGYRITKIDADRQIVHGVVYSPWTLDSHGHYMTDAEVENTCHLFLERGLQNHVDVMHDNELIDAVVVESYIERQGTHDTPIGSWCAATKINDSYIWGLVKAGKLNGYSMEVLSYGVRHEAVISHDSWVCGETQPDPFDGHTHSFLVRLNDDGDVDFGYTSPGGTDNHVHTISRLSVTDPYNFTTHRIVIV